MLSDQFKGCPGEDEVIEGRYKILTADSEKQINQENWDLDLSPGSRILMSIFLEGFSLRIYECPKRCSGGMRRISCSQVAW